MDKNLKHLQLRINYDFRDESLLVKALTHPSYSSEAGYQRYESNQRLEFLGDAVVELVASEYLYRKYPTDEEGELSEKRTSLVFEPALAASAKNLDLGKYIYLGVGETGSHGYEKPSILSDAFEALAGAIYLDGGMDEATRFINRFVLDFIDELSLLNDSKSRIQKYVQSMHGNTLRYETTKLKNDAENPGFKSLLYVNEKLISNGWGLSKREAEQDAAGKACRKLNIVRCT